VSFGETCKYGFVGLSLDTLGGGIFVGYVVVRVWVVWFGFENIKVIFFPRRYP